MNTTMTISIDFFPAALVNAIEDNAVESCKAWAGWPGLRLYEDGEMLWTLTSVPFALFNNVLWARIPPAEVEARIDQALDRVRQRGLPMAWWIAPKTRPRDLGSRLEAKGFTHADSPIGMAAELAALDETLAEPPGLEIEEVLTTESLETWCAVVAPVFEFPPFAAQPWFEMHAALGLGVDRPWRHFMARLDGKPVATASLFLGAGVAGVANVATRPEARRLGIGTALTLRSLHEARRMGYRIGTLCSSKAGYGAYCRLGFREYCRMALYIWMPEQGS